MQTTNNPVFINTNILVYANVSESPFHQAALHAIQNQYDAGIALWISRQASMFVWARILFARLLKMILFGKTTINIFSV